MTRDSPGRSSKPRAALGELTNQLGRRGFSLITRSPSKSGPGNAKIVNKENCSQLGKRISPYSKDSGSEISGTKRPKIANSDNSLPLLKGGKTYRLHSLGNAESVLESNLKTGKELVSVEGGVVVSGSSCNVSQSSSESSSKNHIEIGGNSQDPEEPALEPLGSQIGSTECKDSGFSTIPSTECPPFVGSGFTKTKLQGANPFVLERCMWVKDDAASIPVPDAGSLDDCSCSFCAKAAYILSDLHYMDAKGRMSALMKSKKEANNLVRMCSVGNDKSKGGESSSTSSPLQLDKDLMNRCKSLFMFMEDTFGKECSQLETEISSLKDVREKFKMDMETANETQPDIQQLGSDDSTGPKTT